MTMSPTTGARSAAIESWDDTSAGGRAFAIVIAHRAMWGHAAAKSRIAFHASVHRSRRRLPLENAVWFTSVLPPGVARKVATIRENTSGRMQAIAADAAEVFGVDARENRGQDES
jgi:hypothetical protein